jgi:hypothetical protein
MKMEIQILNWDRHKNMAGLNRLIGSQTSALDNWVKILVFNATFNNIPVMS